MIALLVVQVLPWAQALAGGGIAVLVGDATHPKQAIAYGLGWQGLIGGFLKPEAPARPN